MSRTRLLPLLLLALLIRAESQAQTFSSHAEVSLITCSPGSELYSIFGHSAIRVRDTVTDRDWIFNYGVFDFDTPNFYWKFIRGKLQYRLAIQRMGDFVRSYAAEGRAIKEERLRLTGREKQRLLRFLRINHMPENRYYLYDFFYNNCSTKIWDVSEAQVSDSLAFDRSVYSPRSFRDLLYPYLEKVPWSKLGIDLLLGVPADKTATFEQQMYLPDYLSRNMSHTYRLGASGRQPLLEKEKVILERNEKLSGMDRPLLTPAVVFGLVLLVLAGITFRAGKRTRRRVDAVLLLLTSLFGVVLLFMWFGTNHQQMDWNLNVLWANPLGLFFVYFALRKKMKRAGWAAGVLLAFLLVNLVGWPWLPQQFNLSLLPLILALAVRALDNFLPVCCPEFYRRKWDRRRAIANNANKGHPRHLRANR